MIDDRYIGQDTPADIATDLELLSVRHIDFSNDIKHGEIVVNREISQDVIKFFRYAFELKFPIEKVVPANEYNFDDEAIMADNNSSGFNYRSIAGSDKLSPHALGLAFDINTKLNPYIRYSKEGKENIQPKGAKYNPNQPGTLYTKHPLVIMMKQNGWEWGGNWPPESGRTDYQHFQKLR